MLAAMRLGVVWEPCSNAHYRAIDPMKAMEQRGHDVMWPPDNEGEPDLRRHADCDVVHVFRRSDDDTRRVLAELARSGTRITFDNDIDITAMPKQSPKHKAAGGLKGQRMFAMTVKAARMARAVTTTTDVLAEKYRRAGLRRVHVIDNYLAGDTLRPQRRHEGVVIGWIAAQEHRADADHLKIGEVLTRIAEKHESVRIECVGVNLALPDRYRHDEAVLFQNLPARIGGFDIGIAPLANISYNRMRSNIKLKEYAASGVPWLASPVGPYIGLGEQQGGRLVPDDRWFEALDRMVSSGRERRRLARKAKKWAKSQTIDAVADRWERIFTDAAS
jgi:glycosyltransferase involved in cell wall biosynthesis